MKKSHLFLVAGALVAGCNSDPVNVGTNPVDAATSDGSGSDRPTVDSAVDAGSDTGTPDVATQDTGTDTGPTDTGAMEDTGADAGTPDDTGAMEDTGTTDSGSAADAGSDAGSVTDTGMMTDTGPADVGTDAGPADTGTDTGPADTGVDAGPMDAGSMDAGGGDVVVVSDVCAASTEVCNGRDDDCDGVIDEDACGTHLLITEAAYSPGAGEFIEIHNPTAAPVDLSNVYLSDLNDYACYLGPTCVLPSGRTQATLGNSDFVAHFPAGAMIPAGGYVTVAIAAPADFNTTYMRCPDFFLPRGSVTVGTCTTTQAMVPARDMASSIGSSVTLTDSGEPLTLFRWTGDAALPQDLDYLVYATPSSSNPAVDKTGFGLMLTGGTMMFAADTAPAMQMRASTTTTGNTLHRCDYSEGTETRTGGNGVGGHDETSEPLNTSFRVAAPTPGAISTCN